MRVSSNSIYLRDGRKIGVLFSETGGCRCILNLPLPNTPSATGHGPTPSAAILDARNRLIIQMSKAHDILSVIADEADAYRPSEIRHEINETTEALSAALANVETLKARLTRLGVGTDRAERLEDTVRKTRQMVSNLS